MIRSSVARAAHEMIPAHHGRSGHSSVEDRARSESLVRESMPTPEIEALLREYHFDRIPLARLREALRDTKDMESLHRITEPVRPPSPDCATELPTPGSPEAQRLREEGEAAIARGELAVVILAGGMATRFGSVVKALATIYDDRPPRFLDAKLADVNLRPECVDVTLMTSFATHDAIREVVERERLRHVHLAPQFVSLRLTPSGELFRTTDGELSPYAPGHGDLPEALEVSGTLERLRARGVRTVLMSNVDNVGATVDPTVFALHRASGRRISVELVTKNAGDRGGLPVVLGDRLVLAEAFRLPKEFPSESFPMFNTNTLWIDLDALTGAHPWTWCYARKKVDGQDAVQVERLVGELTWWHSTHYVHVPREGAASRFIPVKDLRDLHTQREAIQAVLDARMR